MFCGTYQEALATALANAKRTGEPRYLHSYMQGWYSEYTPTGDTCEQIMPDGSMHQLYRAGDVWKPLT